MKAWKKIAVVAVAFIAVALITTTALAYSASGQGTNRPYGGYGVAQGPRGGMMHGSMGGPMGYGYSQCSNCTSSYSNPQQCPYNGGSGMRNCWP